MNALSVVSKHLLNCFSKPTTSIVVNQWSSKIIEHYSEKHRAYHTANHIVSMLDLLTKHESHIRNVPVVTLSILFHDIIYDPKSRDNEEKSAELFLKFAEEFNKSIQQEQQNAPVSQDDIRLVEKYILMTKSHKIDDDTLMHDNDAKLFMDFDLDVLSWTPQQYDEYSKQIRQEYSFVEKEAYRSGRTQVLKQLSSGSSIYFSDLWGKEAGSFV